MKVNGKVSIGDTTYSIFKLKESIFPVGDGPSSIALISGGFSSRFRMQGLDMFDPGSWILWSSKTLEENKKHVSQNDTLHPLYLLETKGRHDKWAGPADSSPVLLLASSGTPLWRNEFAANGMSHYTYFNSEEKKQDLNITAYANFMMATDSLVRLGFIFASESIDARTITILGEKLIVKNDNKSWWELWK